MVTLLTVLKFFGIAAACILLLALLFILLLLQIPFRYVVDAQFVGTELQMDAKVLWNAKVVRLWYIQNTDGTHDGELLLFGIRILRMDKDSDWMELQIKAAEAWLNRVSDGILHAPEGPAECLKNIKKTFSSQKWRKTAGRLFQRLKTIIIEVFPKSGNGVIEFGLDDPYQTGQLLEVLALAYPLYGRVFDICPNFSEKMFLADLKLRGKAKIGILVWNAIMLQYSSKSREIYHEFIRLVHNERK